MGFAKEANCDLCDLGTEFLCIIYIETKLICLNFCYLNIADTVLYFFV